ncbi:transmembrane protein 53 isoform X2 [Temnothorax americanus]|uniref:transmembrane protein 53 isoform X2 n=1 Tax=Temnothorax americanus TaxID=1964332 RepID=UPI0040686FB3
MSDQEDLDYCIVFPSFPPSPKDPTLTAAGHRDQREEFVFVYEEDKRPVVILLGWAGCQDRYLAKYSSIYEEKSCITLRYTAPVECLFWRRDKMPYIGKRLLRVITDKRLDEHPIFFHVFSNGGAFLYQHVSLAMQMANTPFKVRGVIFDSAPGERRLTALFKAISAIIGGHPLTNLPMSFIFTFFLSVLWFFEVIAQAFSRAPIQTNPIALAEEAYSWPQLFLYSNSDTLIPASDVEKFASRRAERGVRVQLVLFTNSPHVKHYATYRDVYVNTVCGFIHECLISPSPSRSLMSSLDRGDDRGSQSYDAPPGLTKRVVLPHEASKQQN